MTIALVPHVAAGHFSFDPRINGYQSLDQKRSLREGAMEMAAQAVCFDITNVSNYFFEQSDKDYWEWLVDFPCMAPPFDLFWMECRAPRTIRTERGVSAWEGAYEAMGVLFTGGRMAEADIDEAALNAVKHMDVFRGIGVDDLRALFRQLQATAGDCWTLTMTSFLRLAGRVFMAPYQCSLMLDASGKPVAPPSIGLMYPVDGEEAEITAKVAGFFFPFALALSFLHCKNVTVEDAPDPRTRQGRRADERAGLPTPRYKTLVIEPMKKVLQTEGGIATNGLKKALHICRGHFSHYSEEKPLFGKYSGQFWIPAHVRGSADAGTVVKDYDVKAPKGAQAA